MKYTRLTVEQRKEISDKHKRGCIISTLARQYRITRVTVTRWVEEGQKPRPKWCDQAGRGRKPSLSAKERASIRRSATNHNTVATITGRVNKRRATKVSTSTVRRALVSGSKPLQYARVSSSRVLREQNKKKRVEFCTQHQRAHTKNWVFVDSKYFYLYRQPGGYHHFEWHSRAKTGKAGRSGNPTVMHFYAAVAHQWKSKIHFVPPTPQFGTKQRKAKETFKSQHYVGVMEQIQREISAGCPSATRYHIIRDRAKQHTSNATNAKVAAMNLPIMEDYPPQSWDVNIIENVWGLLDKQLQGARARTPDGWRRAINQAWNNIKQSSIDKLVHQVRGRMASIKENDGAWLGKA